MKPESLQQAHLIYDLEKDYLEHLLKENPAYQKIRWDLKVLSDRFESCDTRKKACDRLIDLLGEMSLEAGFKLGILFAHNYPLNEIISPKAPKPPDFSV